MNEGIIASRPYSLIQQLVRAFLHAFQNFYGLFIMMIAMTYNAGIWFIILSAAFFGYLFFNVFFEGSSEVNSAQVCH